MLALFSVPVALILLTDNILSFIVPIAISDVVKSSFILGLIMGLSSFVGLVFDYIFFVFFFFKNKKGLQRSGYLLQRKTQGSFLWHENKKI